MDVMSVTGLYEERYEILRDALKAAEAQLRELRERLSKLEALLEDEEGAYELTPVVGLVRLRKNLWVNPDRVDYVIDNADSRLSVVCGGIVHVVIDEGEVVQARAALGINHE